jgi:hypothetical protein
MLRPSARLAVALSFAPCLLLGWAISTTRGDGTLAKDDGWRRTAQGWERAATLPATEPVLSAARTPANRWDGHPAVLALLQILAVLGAMYAFPRPNAAGWSWLNEDWRAVFSRSFRASVFGS